MTSVMISFSYLHVSADKEKNVSETNWKMLFQNVCFNVCVFITCSERCIEGLHVCS